VERAAQVPIPAGPENRRVLLDLEVVRGKALFSLDRWRESIPVLRKALAQVPETDAGVRAGVMCFLGLALCAVGEFDEAYELLRTTALDRAKQPGLWAATRVWLGNIYHRRDEYAKALEQFEAIADRPAEEWAGSRESLARMADSYLETGQRERGLVVAEQAYRELRGNGLVHIAFAKALALAGRYQEAEPVLRELDEAGLDDSLRERLYAHSGYVAVGLRNRERAEQWLHKLTALNPNSRYLNPLRGLVQKLPKRPPRIFRW
jgi:tetratricopeptide (TPR) repeat protein